MKRSQESGVRSQEKRARQEAAGIPESKRFGGSPEQDAAFDARPIMDCHVGGVPVRSLPLLSQRMLQMEQTDEGYLANQAAILERNGGRPAARVEISQGQEDKSLQNRGADLREGKDPRHAHQPLKFMDKYKRPGFRLKLLSNKSGELNPDYEVVKKANGDPLKYKGMFVGEIAEQSAVERNAYYQQHSAKRLDQLSEKHREDGGIVAPQK